MKKKFLLGLAAILLLAVAAVGVGKAYAYFTTYIEAKGQRTIHLGDTTTISEEFANWRKDVVIANNADSAQAVWVRAQAFSGTQLKDGTPLQLHYSGSNWSSEPDAEGWYYYNVPIVPGASTEVLSVSIMDDEGNLLQDENSESFNVVVVYETTPAVQNGESEEGAIQYKDADWNLSVEKGESQAAGGGES